MIRRQVKDASLLIIDEISNVRVEKLDQLSRLFGAARERPGEFFGGLSVLLVGDFNQKGPVGGVLGTKAILERFEKGKEIQSLVVDSKYHRQSDFGGGCEILEQCKWIELTEAKRSDDDKQNALVDKMYEGKSILLDDLKIYKLWNKETLELDTHEERKNWLEAPVIVKTNRERISVNFVRLKSFAEFHHTVVI